MRPRKRPIARQRQRRQRAQHASRALPKRPRWPARLIRPRRSWRGRWKNSRIPAQRPAAPHRDQPRGVERIDDQDHDRQIEKREAERERGDVERDRRCASSAPLRGAHLHDAGRRRSAPPGGRPAPPRPRRPPASPCWRRIPSTASVRSSVVSEPPSRSGMTNSPTIGMKHNSAPAATPGSESGSVTTPERLPARAAEIGGRFQQRLVELLEASHRAAAP